MVTGDNFQAEKKTIRETTTIVTKNPKERAFIRKIKVIQRTFRKFLSKKKAAIASVTWMTGTDGRAVLPGFRQSNNKLMPFGTLLVNGIAPITGELTNGIKFRGINIRNLSGVVPNHFHIAWSYAVTGGTDKTSENTRLSIKDIEENLEINLKHFEAAIQQRRLFNVRIKEGDADQLINLTISVLRLRSMNEKIYQECYQKRLEAVLVMTQQTKSWEPLLQKTKFEETLATPPLFVIDDKNREALLDIAAIKSQFEANGYNFKMIEDCKDYYQGWVLTADNPNLKKFRYYQYIMSSGQLTCPFWLSTDDTAYAAMQDNTFATRAMMIKTIDPTYFDRPENQIHCRIIAKWMNDFISDVNLIREAFECSIKRSSIQSLTEEEQTLFRKKRFPLVLATANKLENCTAGMNNETSYPASLQLGEDLRIMVTTQQYTQEAQRWLRAQGLRGKVFVCTREEFEAQQLPKRDQPSKSGKENDGAIPSVKF